MNNANFWETMLGALGWSPVPSLHHIDTDNNAKLKELKDSGGFAVVCTRSENPGVFQRGIMAKTKSPWQHTELAIGGEVGKAARLSCPDLLIKKPSPRWKHPSIGTPVPMVEGIPTEPKEFETVTSGMYIEIDEMPSVTRQGEQVVAFVNDKWTLEQKVKMAIEAYHWYGEFYDVFEIADWILPVYNPPQLKVCSTAVYTWVKAGDPTIEQWVKDNTLDEEEHAPRDTFNWCVAMGMRPICFNCDIQNP